MNTLLQRGIVPLAPILSRHQSSVLGLRFRKSLGRRMQDPPVSFYDKIFWMSAHCDTSQWTRLADKVEVRDFVSERCGSDLLTKLYGVYERAEDIDFDAFPDSFVVKTNNGCASNYIVRSKETADLEGIRAGLAKWLSFPYGELTGQLHYSRIKPRILAEELLYQADAPEETLTDYKFYCFDGDVRYCYVVMDRVFDQRHTHKRMMYDAQWNELPGVFDAGAALGHALKPSAFGDMVEAAEKLSRGIPFVRVDLYEIDGSVKFSEMTFMPGMHAGYTEAFQEELGGGYLVAAAVWNPNDGRCARAVRKGRCR